MSGSVCVGALLGRCRQAWSHLFQGNESGTRHNEESLVE